MAAELRWCPLCTKGYWREPEDALSPCCFIRKPDHRAGLLDADGMVALGIWQPKAAGRGRQS